MIRFITVIKHEERIMQDRIRSNTRIKISRRATKYTNNDKAIKVHVLLSTQFKIKQTNRLSHICVHYNIFFCGTTTIPDMR